MNEACLYGSRLKMGILCFVILILCRNLRFSYFFIVNYIVGSEKDLTI